MTFKFVSGRPCLDFVGTLKYRGGTGAEELLTDPRQLSDWARQAGLVDAAIEVSQGDLEAAMALREAAYRIVVARLEQRRPPVADVELLNKWAAEPRLTPRLLRTGSTRRAGSAAQLLATLAADLVDLLAGPGIDNVKRCAHAGCTRLYIDSSRGHNRHWCGMGTCGNQAKVKAFRARQRAASH
jgi:predicted RNA-binding Zn ribbon-like protein